MFAAALLLAVALPAAAQDATAAVAQETAASPILSSQISVSRNDASLDLELANGRRVRMQILDGRVLLDGRAIGEAARGGTLDRAWRELLDAAIDAPAAELAVLLTEWDAPAGATGAQLDAALESALGDAAAGVAANVAASADADADATAQEAVPMRDSIDRLLQRIEELEEIHIAPPVVINRDRGFDWMGPFRHIGRGIAGVISLLIGYGVLFGLGFLAIMFGGRRYIEGVADTARHATMRSLFVGLAGTFLVIPAYILGMLALAISIIGIPAILIWAPVFPLACIAAAVLGYLAVAHAAGESMAERRFYAADWFQRGNSYYFLLTGLGLMFALFIAAQVVSMAGPWLKFFEGMLTLLGVLVTWLAVSIGFGAVLISRGGTRPVRGIDAAPDIFAEETHA